MSNWTEERKAQAIELYTSKSPTAETNSEVLKEVADELGDGVTANGVRMILTLAGVYVKKEAASATTSKGTDKKAATGEKAEGAKRVSKETQFVALRAAIKAKGAEVDEDIVSKLTGKAAAYFTTVLTK